MEIANYYDCDGCPYKHGLHLSEKFKKIRRSPINPEKNGSKTLLILQSPGLDEWKNGHPISSTNNRSAAHKIESAFQILQKSRKDFDITNAVQCYTGKLSKNNSNTPRDRPVNKLASRVCSMRLEKLIKSENYGTLIVFGSIARSSIENIKIPTNISVIFSRHPSARGISIRSIATILNR
jgi:uracil-DNA glycosylase